MKKQNIKSINTEQNDYEKVHRSVDVTLCTMKGKSLVAYCDVCV